MGELTTVLQSNLFFDTLNSLVLLMKNVKPLLLNLLAQEFQKRKTHAFLAREELTSEEIKRGQQYVEEVARVFDMIRLKPDIFPLSSDAAIGNYLAAVETQNSQADDYIEALQQLQNAQVKLY